MLIQSRENPMVKEAASLISDKKLRKATGLFVVEGARLCSEAVKSGAKVLRAFATEEAQGRYPEYISGLVSSSEEFYCITPGVAEKISDTKTPQGVFAVCRFEEKAVDLDSEGVFVLLSELQDPGNIGTVLRTCEAMDVKGVFLCNCADVLSPKVLRSSMGCLFRLPVKICSSTEEAVYLIKAAGVTTYAAALSETAELLPDVRFDRRSCLLIGNEGSGLSKEVVDRCDKTVMIPMPGKAESLNASAAAAIIIYSAAQQRK